MTANKDTTKGDPGSKPPSISEEFAHRLAEGQEALEQSARARSRIDESRDDLIEIRANLQSKMERVQEQAEAKEARTKELLDLHFELLKQKVSSSIAPGGESKTKAARGPKANMEYHRAIVDTVNLFGNKWRNEDSLERIAKRLDEDKVRTPPSKKWAALKSLCENSS